MRGREDGLVAAGSTEAFACGAQTPRAPWPSA
jgi:hypothetical protein